MKIASKLNFAALAGMVALCVPVVLAQDYDHDRYWDNHEHMTRIERGTTIPVRTQEYINADYAGDRVYHGIVDQDVFGENGRLAIPRGSRVDLKVRTTPDNNLVLDLESVDVHGDRFHVETRPDFVRSQQQGGIVGDIVGAISGGQTFGQTVNVPADTIINFRLEHSMVVDAAPQH